MNPLFEIILYVLILFAIVIGISFVISVFITFIGIAMVDRASKKNAQKILPQLPGTDCGDCECENCAHYAQWVADERKELGKCPHLSQQTIDGINELFPKVEIKERPKLKDIVKGWFKRGK